jgi:ABC-type transport system involved in multi-copper enzyme maturation permease subunit
MTPPPAPPVREAPAAAPFAPAGLASLVVAIARHELAVTLRTRRALALLGIYMLSAAFAGLAYVLAVRLVERQALDALTASGLKPDAAVRALSLASEQGYAQIVAFFAGVAPAAMDPSIRDSLVLPALLWGSLAFLPFVVVLTSFDMIAGDLATRSILFTTLRAPRLAVLLGKVVAQLLIVTVLTTLASVTLVLIGGSLLRSFSFFDALVGLVRVTLLLTPFAFCYLGLTAFASASVRQPTLALFSAVGLMVALRVLGWLESVPADSSYGPLRFVALLSPARYHAGLWQGGVEGPLASTAAYVLIGAAFVALAARQLGGRDL